MTRQRSSTNVIVGEPPPTWQTHFYVLLSDDLARRFVANELHAIQEIQEMVRAMVDWRLEDQRTWPERNGRKR